ncbi:MAG: hypothetical protein ACI9R3_004416 [Verrucomicrobiales bacterium]|jgi:hypothetical protein
MKQRISILLEPRFLMPLPNNLEKEDLPFHPCSHSSAALQLSPLEVLPKARLL